MYLIDRGGLLMQMMHKFHYELPDGCNNPLYGDVIKVIEDAPLIEAVSVRHGRWIDAREKRLFGDHYFLCSNCKSRNGLMIPFNYCPHCGAKMDLEE